MKPWIWILLFGLLAGCGDGGGSGDSAGSPPVPTTPAPPPAQPGKIELKGQVNITVNSFGDVRYLGELINNGQGPACFVKIIIDSKNASGGLIDSDLTYVYGSTLSVGSIETDTCLNPGEVGGFDMFTSIDSTPASFSVTINWDSDRISTPVVTSNQVVLSGPITESTNFLGDMTIGGFIKNIDTTHTIEFVKISFIAIKGDRVVDTDFTYINGSTCNAADTCLAPGALASFEAGFSLSPSEVDSYYYKINYDIR